MGINLVAALVAAVIHFMLGGLWYSKILFAEQWMVAVGKTEDEIKQGSNAPAYIGSFISTFLLACILAYFINWSGSVGFFKGIQIAFFAWLGFVATTLFTNNLFQKSSLKLFLIDSGYWLAGMLIMGAILGVWQ